MTSPAVAVPPPLPVAVPASRAQRLRATTLDAVLIGVMLLPMAIFGGYYEMTLKWSLTGMAPPFAQLLPWIAMPALLALLMHGYTLYARGKSIGQLSQRIRAATREGHALPPLRLLLRQMLSTTILFLPLIALPWAWVRMITLSSGEILLPVALLLWLVHLICVLLPGGRGLPDLIVSSRMVRA